MLSAADPVDWSRIYDQSMSSSEQSVWVFHGDGARHAAGVFATKQEALGWIEQHKLSGLLTEYPLGVGAYDQAVARGWFTPSKEHHGTPEHVGRFSPGRTEHLHVINGAVENPD